MRIQLITSDWPQVPTNALLLPLFEKDSLEEGPPGEADRLLSGLLREISENGEWTGKRDEILVIHRPSSIQSSRLILVGAGKREAYDSTAIRQILSNAIRRIKAYDLRRVGVIRRSTIDPAVAAQAAVEGVILGTYSIDEYKTGERQKTVLEEILLIADPGLDEPSTENALVRGEILGNATNIARSLVNQPGNRLSPAILAETARDIADRFGLEVEILGEPELEQKGMHALLAVARGSDEPARLIVLRHMGAGHNRPFSAALVGKGVTFDSGGLSLKSSEDMEGMKADKAGACAVLGAMQAISQIKLEKNILAVIPAVENLPSGRAQRPGDVIRSMSGKTVEVLNTDAEGRLILADAIHYAKLYEPGYIIDLATLTGACVVALGMIRAGLFSNDDELCRKLVQASRIAGEKVWRMPLDDEYRRDLDSYIADIKNYGERWGGAITAAKFLEEFVGNTPWCHLDIAGVDMVKIDDQLKSPTGFGVRTLVELVSLP